MKIHEYQSCQLFTSFGIPCPRGYLAQNAEEALDAARQIGTFPLAVKAQIHSGGRGKAGGVKICKSEEEVQAFTKDIIGKTLYTHQTGPEGKVVRKVYVTEGSQIEKEYYVSMTVDSANASVVMIASADGGTEIEELSQTHPEKIFQLTIDPIVGYKDYNGWEMAKKLGFSGDMAKKFVKIARGMYNLFMAKDCSLVEINPLITTKDGQMVALDAKVNFDDNALFRHPDILALRDLDEEDPKEVEASKYDLNYVSLDGSVGCMVNGAGLAMATMDIIKSFGGEPANFLDVGGSATTERVTAAFEILLADPNVKAILVNIFGGIMKCDVIAQGIVEAAKKVKIDVPVVVRLDGTHADLGREILSGSGLDLIAAETFAESARKAVEMAAMEKEGNR